MLKKIMFAATLLVSGLTASFADTACGKVEWVWQAATGGGAFAFKLVSGANTYQVNYNSTTSPMLLSNILTAKSGYFNLCVDYTNIAGSTKPVNSVNTMTP
jgi:hypothetical protein